MEYNEKVKFKNEIIKLKNHLAKKKNQKKNFLHLELKEKK